MPCDACGCACAYGGRGDDEQQLAAPLLLDLEAAVVGSKPPADDDDDHTATTVVEKMAAVLSRIRVSWVFMFLLWVYLLNWARRYVLWFTDGSIWFTTFAVIVTTIPLTELFYTHAMYVEEIMEEGPPPPPPPPPNAGTRERIVARLRDIFTMTVDAASYEAHKEKMSRCILRGLLVLVWLFVIDFGRRVFEEVDLPPAIFFNCWLFLNVTPLLVMAGLYIEGLPPVVSQT